MFSMSKITSINPSTEEPLEDIEVASEEEVSQAVSNARKAFPQWSKTTIDERIKWLKKLIPLIEYKKDEISRTIAKEMGKPMDQSLEESERVVNHIKFYAKNIKDFLKQETVFGDNGEKDILMYDPLGVIAIITPWNYPVTTVFSALIPALLCGNTVVLKPSELTLTVGKQIGELFKALETQGFPKNVFNLVLGGKETGKQLVEQDVDLIQFTGSGRAGKEIMRVSADKLHRLLFELGGKDPAIVCEDGVDMADKVVWGACRNTGQICCAIERVYVLEEIYDEFVKKAVEKAKSLVVGDPLLKETDMGPFVAKFQMDVCIDHIKDAVKKGAKIEFGGNRINGKGYFFEPTIITNVDHDMKIMTEETFGPVVPIMKVSSIEEAIKLSNESEYGLAASVWTKDIEKGKAIAKQLQVGVSSVNFHGGGCFGSAWGGAKMSGIGRLGSKEGTHAFTNVKTLRVSKLN